MFRIASIKLKKVYGLYIIIILEVIIYWGGVNRQFISVWHIMKSLLFFPYLFGDQYSLWLPWAQVWYIPVWLVASVFYISLLKWNKKEVYYVILWLTVFLGATLYNASEIHSLNYTLEIMVGIIPFGIIRGFMDTGIGIIVGLICEQYIINPLLKISLILQILCFIGGTYILLCDVTVEGDFIFIFILGLLIFLFHYLDGIGWVLDYVGLKLHWLCSLSLPIYFLHTVVIVVLNNNKIIKFIQIDPFSYILLVIILSLCMRMCTSFSGHILRKINSMSL